MIRAQTSGGQEKKRRRYDKRNKRAEEGRRYIEEAIAAYEHF